MDGIDRIGRIGKLRFVCLVSHVVRNGIVRRLQPLPNGMRMKKKKMMEDATAAAPHHKAKICGGIW